LVDEADVWGGSVVGRMILPKGVTGFYNRAGHKPPTTDGRQFKKIGYDLVTRNGGSVQNFHEPTTSTNFYHLEALIYNRLWHIVLNVHYPILAFASNVDYGKITFVDHPEWKNQLSQFYNVMDTSELDEPLHIESEKELNRSELEQIAYWKPKTKGEVIFNYWD
jgi:hypothetical protein